MKCFDRIHPNPKKTLGIPWAPETLNLNPVQHFSIFQPPTPLSSREIAPRPAVGLPDPFRRRTARLS